MRSRNYAISALIFSVIFFLLLIFLLDLFSTNWFNKHQSSELDHTILASSIFDPALGFKPLTHPHYIAGNSPKTKLILLGDSIAYGYRHSHPNQIATLLHQRAPGIEIINLSGVGFNSLQSYLNLFIYLLREPWPNYIIWLNGPNDPRENMKTEFYISRPEIRKNYQNFCVDSFPSNRHPHFFRTSELNKRNTSHIIPKLLGEIAEDILSKFYQQGSLLEVLQSSELMLCAKEKDVPDGQDVMIYLNQKIAKIASEHKTKFASILLPYKEFYQIYQGNETLDIEEKMTNANIEVLNISSLLKNETANSIFLTPLNDSDDHFSLRTHQIIVQAICQNILGDFCLDQVSN